MKQFKVGDKVKFTAFGNCDRIVTVIKTSMCEKNEYQKIHFIENGIEDWAYSYYYTLVPSSTKISNIIQQQRETCKCPFINLGLVHNSSCSYYKLGEWS